MRTPDRDSVPSLRGAATRDRAAASAAPRGAGLTRRERRVKKILLEELNTLNGATKTWAAYQERQHLVGRLDVAFIDREIAKMARALRPRPVLFGALALLGLAYVVFHVASNLGQAFTWATGLDVLLALFTPVSMTAAVVLGRRAVRRRLWIYQALRELSDADDEGVQLDESVRLADLLIDRIVDAEEGAASLHRIRS